MKKTTKLQTKPTVDREAVRVLAIELGVPAAARKLGLNRNTVHSWARRYNWNLPERAGRPGIVPARDLHTQPGDVLLATHKELEDTARTSILQAVTNAAKLVAKKPGLDVSTVAQLRDLASALVRLCDNGKPQASVTVYSDKTMIVCDEKRRAELIEQRQRLLEQEATGKVIELNGHKAKAAATALPAPETRSDANVGTGNGTAAQDPSPDVHFQHMQSIGKAETWKTSEPENHGGGGSFGPYPEEYE
jgi:Putative ATPase subunit of terminase (gpP-like)